VLSRAELSRTGLVFVVLFLAPLVAWTTTGAGAREFRAADGQTEDDPTVQALRMSRLIAERTGGWRNAVRPAKQLDDLEGLRIHVQQSELISEMIRALGAEPVELPYGQALTGLANHLIDGAEAARDPVAAAPIERIRKVE
jgi:TRAP-type C4-dicarboxylate transport system substrate-binding protein